MKALDIENIATYWIRMHHSEANSEEYRARFWSLETWMLSVARAQPTHLGVLFYDIQKHPGELILSNLAAGPLEDLLVNHGRLALTWIDQYCTNERKFVEVLRLVGRTPSGRHLA